MGIANGLTIPNNIANGNALDAPTAMANWNALLVALNRALLDAGNGNGMNASGSQIHNLGAGTASTDAVNLGQLAGYLPLAGGTLTGTLNGLGAAFSGAVGVGSLTVTGTVSAGSITLASPVPISQGGTGAATLAAAFAALVASNTVALPGQFVFNDGTIVKFGQSVQVGGSGLQTVTFATPFPNQCVFALAGNAGNSVPSAFHNAGSLSKTGMVIGSASSSGVPAGAGVAAWWIAVGN